MPQSVQGIAGDSVVLECEPPRGHPEPQIRWKKNGQSLELDLDLGVDSDRYVNINKSLSGPALAFLIDIKNQLIDISSVCGWSIPSSRVTIHPSIWLLNVCLLKLFVLGCVFGFGWPMEPKRNRIRVEESGNLVITKLAASDQGRYICVAQNIVGIRETSPVVLTVNGKEPSPFLYVYISIA